MATGRAAALNDGVGKVVHHAPVGVRQGIACLDFSGARPMSTAISPPCRVLLAGTRLLMFVEIGPLHLATLYVGALLVGNGVVIVGVGRRRQIPMEAVVSGDKPGFRRAHPPLWGGCRPSARPSVQGTSSR